MLILFEVLILDSPIFKGSEELTMMILVSQHIDFPLR